MQELAPLIYDLALMLGLAGMVVLLFQRIHQPVVLGYLVAGLILGPHTPPHTLVRDTHNIQILSELGVIFLMFSLGLEFSFHKLTRVGFSASVTGIIEVLLMSILGYAAGRALNWSYYDSIFLGAALSISSTTIIIKAINDLGLKTKRFAELIFGILIIEDLIAILLLVALSTLVATKNLLSVDMVFAAFKLILVVGAWFLIGYFLVPSLLRRIAAYINDETLTIISVALCLIMVCIAGYFHYSTALGAFIMGSILAESSFVHHIEELIRPIRDVFAAVFFISVGMLIDPTIIVKYWQVVLFLAALTIIGKLLMTGIGTLLTGQSVGTSVRVGFSMAQVGEFSFIIVGLGLALGVTNKNLYPIIVAVSGITTFTTPYLIRLSAHVANWLEKTLPQRTKYFLQGYSAWVYRIQATSHQHPAWRGVIFRYLVNAIIVAIVFTLVHRMAFPKFMLSLEAPWLVNTACLLLAILLSSPFIWGMLFAYKAANIPDYATTKLNPLVFLIWLLTLLEVAVLSIIYFHSAITVSLFIGVACIFFLFSYRHLEKSYHWFETQLISNIKTQSSEPHTRYEELAPWDTHLVEIEIGKQSPFIDKALNECHIRQKFGVNVVAIVQGTRIIPAPRGDDVIASGDKLIVLGNDQQIDALRKENATIAEEREPISFLQNFALKAFYLEEHHKVVGKTIRDSQIRENLNGLVVGLERDNKRILNPDPDVVLQPHDLILIVGEVNKLAYFDISG